jgi:serine/threonine protein kinase
VIDNIKVNFSEHHERTLEKEIYQFLITLGVAQHTAQLSVDLLSKFLLLDPLKRISAIDALDHEYFAAPPLPSRPGELPMYKASHELTRRKQESRARAPRGNHQTNELDQVHDPPKRMLEGVMPSTWGGASAKSQDERGRRDIGFRGSRMSSYVPSRDAPRERERRRSKSPSVTKKVVKEQEPEVKYGRR